MADVLVDTDIFVDHLRGVHELRPAAIDRARARTLVVGWTETLAE